MHEATADDLPQINNLIVTGINEYTPSQLHYKIIQRSKVTKGENSRTKRAFVPSNKIFLKISWEVLPSFAWLTQIIKSITLQEKKKLAKSRPH